MKLPVGKKAFVLEIGSGHNPHPRSDILCDQNYTNNQQRQRFGLKYDRPLVIAKGELLPFKNKTFDFIYCAQVLEHTKNPAQFIKELERVAKTGMLVVPNILRERLFGWHYHRWFFYQKNQTLFYLPKRFTEQTQFAHFIHLLFQNSVSFKRNIATFDKKLNIYLLWNKKINLEKSKIIKTKIIKKTDEQVGQFLTKLDYNHAQDLIFLAKNHQKTIISKIKANIKQLKWDHKISHNLDTNYESLKKYLYCPFCQGHLYKKKSLECSSCQRKYLLQNGVPIFTQPELGHK